MKKPTSACIIPRDRSCSAVNIAFDIDGVVLKSIEVILARINHTTGKNIRPADLKSWDLEPLGLDVPTLKDAVDYMYAQPRIEPYEEAPGVLSKIFHCTGKPLLFITGRIDPETARRQLQALPWNPTIPDMVITGGDRDKRTFLTATGADFIVEDDPHHLGDYLEVGIGVGLMVQPWNRHVDIPVTERFCGWRDLENWFMRL